MNKDTAEKALPVVCLVGLGYVGMPLALEFAKQLPVIGFDINQQKIANYQKGVDPTGEVGSARLKASKVHFTSDEREISKGDFVIVAVPTPVYQDHMPDLRPLRSASEIIGRNLKPGAIVVYESTVSPGITENVCAPILEKNSGLKCGSGFKVGYSPERINPGDPVHKVASIKKVVSGMDEDSLMKIKGLYDLIIKAGTYPVSSIKVAEAIKVTENSQRDVNIAFINEMAVIFEKLGISTKEVVDGMNTKWNALGFQPGLVGGHCIGVDPYYIIEEAEGLGYHPRVLTATRQVNNQVAAFVGGRVIKRLALLGKRLKGCKVAVLGVTFKEDCPDIRNSKVVDIIRKLQDYGIVVEVADPWADPALVKRVYGLDLKPLAEIQDADCLLVAVAHQQYKDLSMAELDQHFKDIPEKDKLLIDVKSIYDPALVKQAGFSYWSL